MFYIMFGEAVQKGRPCACLSRATAQSPHIYRVVQMRTTAWMQISMHSQPFD